MNVQGKIHLELVRKKLNGGVDVILVFNEVVPDSLLEYLVQFELQVELYANTVNNVDVRLKLRIRLIIFGHQCLPGHFEQRRN